MKLSLLDAGKIISESHDVVLTTHFLPDGDGLGAEAALYHYLARLGKNVRIINPDAMPSRYRFLDPSHFVEVQGHLKQPLNQIDLVVVVDTGDYRRIGNLWKTLYRSAKKILFLDHHPRMPDEHIPADKKEKDCAEIIDVIDERSSSIGELLYRMFNIAHDVLDPHSSTFRLSPEIALGLYVSIMTDTNSFRYSRTTALSHRIAADLIDYGLQPEEIYAEIYSTKSAEHLRLIGEVLSKVECSADGRLAWVEIPKALRQKYGASADDTQSIVNFLLLLKSPEVLVLVREEDDGKIKASLKSKGRITVNGVAAEFGGGGHDYAAGFTAQGELGKIRKDLISSLEKLLKSEK